MTTTGTGTARVAATCGELVQGVLDGRPFQVPCPLAVRGEVRVEARPGTGRVWGAREHPKARDAAKVALRHAGSPRVDLRLLLRTPVRRGAGMGSSTCDVVGTLRAASRALGVEMSRRTSARLAVGIEPTNGVMFDRLVAFDHVAGRVVEPLGDPPPIRVLVLDLGGRVDTLDLHSRKPSPDRAASGDAVYRDLLARLREGIRTEDPEVIGEAATLSARSILPPVRNGAVEVACDLSRRFGGFGVAAAHSGTVAGVLLPDDPDRVAAARDRAVELSAVAGVLSDRLEVGDGAAPAPYPEEEIPCGEVVPPGGSAYGA